MVLQLDNVDGLENFQPDWARHVEVIRRYSPAIERWRGEVEANMPERLRRRSDAAQLVDKYLWTMSGENSAGDPTIFHDGGNGYGLMADRVSRTPPGSSPDLQIRNAWNLVENNPKTWTDWGEGSSYQGKAFGALGVIAPYDPNPGAVHPTQGDPTPTPPPVKPVEPGNIDLGSRPQVKNADGSVSTVRSISINADGREVLIPTVVDGKVVSNQDAIDHYRSTGEHLGVFKDSTDATAYAGWLHQSEAAKLSSPRIRPPSVGEGDLAGATTQPQGWVPPAGYASSSDVPLVEKLRIAREKRLRDTGYIPPEDSTSAAGSLSGSVLSTGQVSPAAYEQIQHNAELSQQGNAAVDKFAASKSLVDHGLSLASSVFSRVGDLGLNVPNPPSIGGPPSSHRATVGAAAEQSVTGIPALQAVQDVAGDVGGFIGSTTGLQIPTSLASPGGGQASSFNPVEIAGREIAKGLVPTTPAELLLMAPQAGEAAAAAKAVAGKVFDESAVRLAANETFDRLAPPSLLRHERAGAAIAQDAAGLPVDPRSPFARSPAGSGLAPIDEWVDAEGRTHIGLRPGAAAEARQGGAQAGRNLGPEVAGGGAGQKAYANKVRNDYVAALGEDQAVRQESKFAKGQTWADYGDALEAMKGTTPSWQRDPGSASVNTRFRGDPNNPADVAAEMRRGVADVQAQRAGTDARAQVEAANARLGGARTGREAGSDVGGGRAGFTPGRPADAQSDEAWAGRVARAKGMAEAAAPHRFWYDNSSKGILAMAHGDVGDADLITRIAAVGSNQITVPQQGRTILQGWQQWKAGEAVTGAANMRTVSSRVDAALRMSNDQWDAHVVDMIKKGDNQKVTNFWLDMMDAIDPGRALKVREAAGATESATVDMWMLRAFGYANDQSPTSAQYRTIVGGMQSIAKDLGWTPKQVQAAIWVQQIVDSGKPLADAATDYGTAVAAHQARLRNEILPTPSSPRFENVGMALKNAPPEAVAEYAKTVDNAFRDEQGADILARLLGLPVDPVHGNPLVSGTISKGPARGLANQAQADVVDAYASARAAALGQDEVQWFRPFDLKSAGFHNGVRFDVGREITHEDIRALQNELADLDLMYIPEGTKLSVVRPPSDADWAARAANSDAVPAAVTEANKAFRKRVDDAAVQHFGEVSSAGEKGTIETFATDGRRFPLDGQSLSSSTLGRPDVRSAVDAIAERVAAADDVFAAAHTPGITSAAEPGSAAGSRLEGARQGRQYGSEVAGGAALPPGERPKTSWTITPKEGAPYSVETNAGPVSSSTEEAQARFARNTADQAALNTRNAVDRRVGAAQQAQEGVAALRAGEDPRVDYSLLKPVERPTREKPTWVDPGGRVFEVTSGEHTDILKGIAPSTAITAEADTATRTAMDALYGDGWVRMITHDADRYSPRAMLETSGGSARQVSDAITNVAEKMTPAQRAQTDVLIDLMGSDRTIHSTLDSYLASGGDVRRAGARAGRMFGGDVGGGSGGLIDPNTGRPYGDRRPSIINPETDRAFGSQARPRVIDPETGKPFAPVQGPQPAPVAPTAAPVDTSPQFANAPGAPQQHVPGSAFGPNPTTAPNPITPAPSSHWGPLQMAIDQVKGTVSAVTDPAADRNILHNIAAIPGTAQGMITAFDFGNILRQNQALGWRDPRGWLNAAKQTIGAMADAKVEAAAKQAMEASPIWDLATGATRQDRANALSDLLYKAGHGVSADLQNVESGGRSYFMYGKDAAHAIPGREGLDNTVLSRLAKSLKYMQASERGYTTGVNVQGMKTLEDLFAPLIAAGEDNLKVYEDLMHVTNLARGRSGTELATALGRTRVLFSPQFMFSRPQLVNAMRDGTLAPEARKLAREAVVGMAAGQVSLLGLLGVTGAATGLWSVNPNPLSGDFGALKIGNTRIDAMAGFAPLIKTTARVAAKASDAAFGTDMGGDVMAFEDSIRSFLENKAAPIPGLLEKGIFHKQWPDPKDWKTYVNLVSPMIAMSVYDSIANNSAKDALLAVPTTAVGELFGAGSNTYATSTDTANSLSQGQYGRKFDDLTRDERLAVIGSAPAKDQKALAKTERSNYEGEQKKAGFQDYWSPDRKAQFYQDHPEFETQAWYFDRRSISNADTVDKVLALNVPNREVRFAGLPVNIARDDNTKQAWADSKDIVQWYTTDVVESQKNLASIRMYKKQWDDLSTEQQSSVVSNVRDNALQKDPEANAWMYWWGRVNRAKTPAATRLANGLMDDYGPGADSQGAGGTIGTLLSEPPPVKKTKVVQPVATVPARPR